jgi:GNAT superfamily N-acetyltransferase
MIDKKSLLAQYDREMRVEIEYPEARKEILPEVVRFISPSPGMNFILYSCLVETNADRVIQEQIEAFKGMGRPLAWKVYDHDHPVDLKERLVKHGFEQDEEPGAIMVLDLHDVHPALLAPQAQDVRKLQSNSQLEDVIWVEERVWGENFGWIRQRLGSHMAMPGYLSVYVAYVENRPACAAWIYFHTRSQFASLWGGSTLEEYRQRGLYKAILAARVQEARRRGYRYLTIDASAMSEPIVARFGFHLLDRACDYAWKGAKGRDRGPGIRGE